MRFSQSHLIKVHTNGIALMSRKQTFPNSALPIQMLSEEYKYIIGPTENTFITEIIFIDLLKHIFLPTLGN
jgi:hypothetical protein